MRSLTSRDESSTLISFQTANRTSQKSLYRGFSSSLENSIRSCHLFCVPLAAGFFTMSFVNSDSDNNSFGSRNSIRTRRSRSGRRIYPRGNDDYMMPQDPIPFRPRKLVKHQTPQEAIDEFWAKFTTKAPGKGEALRAWRPKRHLRLYLWDKSFLIM